MKKIAPHVFVNPDMSPADKAEVAGIAMVAKERIINFYGGVISSPDILACSTQASFKRLGGNSQRGLLLGTSKILISPKGLTAPILTHEWSHAELRARMDAKMDGVFGIPSMPTWFDEGLAVVVSEEPSHSEKIWETIVEAKMAQPKLKNLETLSDWNRAARCYGDVEHARGVPGKICVVYAIAGHAVRQWYRRVGIEGLLKLIAAVKAGKAFDTQFSST